MKTIYSTIFFLSILMVSSAQNKHNEDVYLGELSGTIIDASSKPLPFVNVLLLNIKDSSLIKGTISKEDGAFNFDKMAFGTYLISTSMVGFKKAFTRPLVLSAEQQLLKVGIIKVEPLAHELNAVTVSVKKPFIEQAIDRTIVNVANSIIGSGSTALEVLEKSPGITIDYQKELLQMRGKEGVIVQIDGKQSYLSPQDMIGLLRTMSSDNIDKIELITNPSARYDAAGNSGIINIRLKKNNNIGTNGSLSVAAGSGFYDRERASIQLNHKTPKMNVFGNYSFSSGGDYWDFNFFQNQPDPITNSPEQRNFIKQKSFIPSRNLGNNLKAGLDYSINKQTSIGLVWTGFLSNRKEHAYATSAFQRAENLPIYLETHTDKRFNINMQNHIGNLNFQHSFGDKGGQLTADIDVGFFSRDFSNNLVTKTTILTVGAVPPPTLLLITMPTTVDIRTFKADYNRILRGGWKMEAGIKSADVKTDNNLELSTDTKGFLAVDTALSNHFIYTEQVNAAYMSFVGKIKTQTEVQIGLRAEHTHSIGNSLTLKQIIDRKYFNVFPSIFVSHPISKAQTVVFSYSYRIDRPNYQSINPGRGYIDPYTYSQGDPTIKPQFTHALEVKYNVANKIYLSLAADFTNDLLQNIIHITNGNTLIRTWQNAGKVQGYTLTGSIPLTIMKGWTLQTNVLAYYKNFQFSYENTFLEVQNASGRVNLNNAFVLGKGWTAELSGWINTPQQYDIITSVPWIASADVGVQKAISPVFKVKLSVQDIFFTNQLKGTIDFPQTGYVNYNIYRDSRIVMLNLTHSFGNQQLKTLKQRRAASEEETKRAN